MSSVKKIVQFANFIADSYRNNPTKKTALCWDDFQLGDYAAGALAPAKKAGMDKHLLGCAWCIRRVMEIGKDLQAVDSSPMTKKERMEAAAGWESFRLKLRLMGEKYVSFTVAGQKVEIRVGVVKGGQVESAEIKIKNGYVTQGKHRLNPDANGMVKLILAGGKAVFHSEGMVFPLDMIPAEVAAKS